MANDSEALTQLSRLIGEWISPSADVTQVQRVLDARLDRLARGIVAEAVASDDVFDRESGIEFVAARVEDFAKWLSAAAKERLLQATKEEIEAW